MTAHYLLPAVYFFVCDVSLAIFLKYLSIDVTEVWTWNRYDPTRVRSELNKIAKAA